VLGDQGVEVTYVTRTADAVQLADAGTTLLVASDMNLLPEQIDALLTTEADLVLVEPGYDLLEGATGGTATLGDDWSSPDALREPGCSDPDALAAGSLRSSGFGLTATGPGSLVCFPGDDSPPDTGAYLVHDGARRVVAFDDASLLTNSRVDEDGNAALALRALGQHESLTWFVPGLLDTSVVGDEEVGVAALPPWVAVVLVQLLVVALFAALWRGRRLGPLVTEDLPVVVRASETARGRGRLYRRARSRGHAAAALRAHSADRMASRLGLPRSAGAPVLIDAIVRATHRPAEQVAHLLYGPPPADDAALLELARHLDQLESEVFHP
jgi:predicted nucleic acid-binding protein